jgi:hypothetical protein
MTPATIAGRMDLGTSSDVTTVATGAMTGSV